MARGGAGRPWVRLVIGGVVTVVVLLAVLVVTVAAVGEGRGRSGAARGPAAVVAAEPSVTGTPASVRTAAGAPEALARTVTDARADPEAPRRRPALLLEELAEARAAAWREASPALLHAADAPRSSASVRDAAAVAELARAGLRYTGLRYVVAEAETVSATPERAVLRARIDTGPYAVTGPTGSTARPAVRGSAVLVHLSWTDAGWRVADLRPDD